jgi:mxaJ protein
MTPRSVIAAVVALVSAAAARGDPTVPAVGSVLRVCADPNNLPFTNRRQEGFENRLAALVAGELGAKVDYTWWAQRRGFLRNTLFDKRCDVVMGLPREMDTVLTTRPYYSSSYVFLSRADRHLTVHSLDDPVLRDLRIGVPLVGDDGANSPPAHALSRRGITEHVIGYSVYGDYSLESPPARIVEGVAAGQVDVALVWGPLAGFFATRQRVPMHIVPVTPGADGPDVRFTFAISMGVRRDDRALRSRLDDIIVRRASAIHAILAAYGVPEIPAAEEP